jgi:hypothetical protein
MRWRVGKLEILEEDVLSSAEVGLVGSSFWMTQKSVAVTVLSDDLFLSGRL